MRISIADPDDPRIAVYRGLRDHAARQRDEQPGARWASTFVCESDLVIERALRSGQELQSVLISAARTKPLDIPDDVPLFAAEPAVLERIAGRPHLRDPLACFTRPVQPSVAEVVAGARNVAVLQNVTNPNNMGVIMRCAAGLGMDAVLIDMHSCDPLYRRSVRASMGEVFAITHARIGELPAGLDELHDAGYASLALTPHESAQPLAGLELDATQRVAVLLGAEGPGLPEETLSAATHRVGIPMANGVDSLNVAAAAAIAFHAVGVGRA